MCVMEKVYFLLRNNAQTGPYTLQQLQNQQLKPSDLIWTEGESHCWRSVKELGGPEKWIHQLQQPEANRTQNANIGTKHSILNNITFAEFVEKEQAASTPASPDEVLEKWAEAIRNRAAAHAAAHPERAFQHPEIPTIKPYTYYSDENPIEVVVHKKEARTISGAQLLMIAAVTTVVTAGWYGKIPVLTSQSQAAYTAIAGAPTVFHIEPKREKTQAVLQNEPDTMLSVVTEMNTMSQKAIAQTAAEKAVKTNSFSLPAPVATESENTAASPQPEVVAIKTPAPNQEKKIQEEVIAKEAAPEKQAEKTSVMVSEEENQAKRKTFGQAIKGLFKKKKKDTNEDDLEASVNQQ
jgi:hypothetical protein